MQSPEAIVALRRAFLAITHEAGVPCPTGCYLCRPLSQSIGEGEAAVFAQASAPVHLASLANQGVDSYTNEVYALLEADRACKGVPLSGTPSGPYVMFG